ncbi:hypothetical protein [Evansella halocellulosilytica]|nr:hypothetical protein [Evansella halocellulosilytica]
MFSKKMYTFMLFSHLLSTIIIVMTIIHHLRIQHLLKLILRREKRTSDL